MGNLISRVIQKKDLISLSKRRQQILTVAELMPAEREKAWKRRRNKEYVP